MPGLASRRRERGVVLILAIFAVVLLSVLAVGISAAVRVELRAAHSSLERMQGLFLAEAGIRQARAILLYDDPNVDTLMDAWGPLADDPLDQPRELGAGIYRVQVEDTCGRIDTNYADLDTLTRLTGDLQVALSVIAWREPQPSADDAYYQSLPHPYAARHAPFQTVGELLLVRGVTPDMLFGKGNKPGLIDLVTTFSRSLNTSATGGPRLPLDSFYSFDLVGSDRDRYMAMFAGMTNSAIGMYEALEIANGYKRLSAITPGKGYTSLAQLVTVASLGYDKVAQIIDYVTVRRGDPEAAGLVNVNTAPPEVIAALPGGSLALGQAIVTRRGRAPFMTLGDFVDFLVQQSNGANIFIQIIDSVTVKSSAYMITSTGYPPTERGARTLRALVRRWGNTVRVVQQAEEDRSVLPQLDAQQATATRRNTFAFANPAG